MTRSPGNAPHVDSPDAAVVRPVHPSPTRVGVLARPKRYRSSGAVCSIVFGVLLTMPYVAAADGKAAAPVCKGSNGYADAFGGRRTFLLRPDWLAATKSRGAADSKQAEAWTSLFAAADQALNGPTYSVVNKTRLPPSGDKHDYMSMGPYWWPDKTRPNGEPYIRRDGEVNPERNGDGFDATTMDRLGAAVEALSLAHYLSDDRRYANKAAELIRAWFLDPATRMNPNANFAQGVPGRTPGRGAGVLDTTRLTRVVEGIGLIAPAKVLSAQELTALERWFSDYTTWMMNSPNGREERGAANNHGLWYDFQLVHFALFARRDDVARAVIDQVPAQRLEKQIDADGKMPKELARTRAYHYMIYALQAAVRIADLAGCVNVDSWQGPGAPRLKAALDFLVPYVGREEKFPYPDLKPGPDEGSYELFLRAAWGYGTMEYRRAAGVLAEYNPASEINLTMARP